LSAFQHAVSLRSPAFQLIGRSWQADNLWCGTAEVRDFKELKVWQRSHRLTLAVYDATGNFPREETYGLTAQLRRCSASIPANIAEGCGRSGEAELARFMLISMGSASELEYHLLLARDLGYISAQDYQKLLQQTREIKRMLSTFITRLRHNKLKC
jgi:four helix bundle protein